MNIKKTRDIKNPHRYITAMQSEYGEWCFDEEMAPLQKGLWRQDVFKVGIDHPLDLEIGTGNGYFFAHRVGACPERCLVGIEVKFKPLIQSIRRALFTGSKSMRIVRYDARFIKNLFAPGELNTVFIHHPDPWEKKRKQKHRLLKSEFLLELWDLQRPGSYVEFKTDSRDYFLWATEEIKKTPYQVERYTLDLHQSEWAKENFVTHFESIFIRQKTPINYLWLRKPAT
jgi:tRNA (guanine-N7-)-methyltransferase